MVRRREPKCRRHHADDREWRAPDQERTAHDIRVAPELRAPQVVSDDDDAGRPGPLVVGAQDAAQHRGRAQDIERRGGGFDARYRETGAAHVEVDGRRPVGRERAERPEGCPPERVVARGGMFVDGVAPVAERADATVGISGQRSFERVDRMHRRQADRDPDRERANGDEAEPGSPDNRPEPQPDVDQGRAPRRQPQGLCPDAARRRKDVPEIAAAHFGGRQAACHVVVEGVVEVTQNEWRLGAADEQGREEPSDARPAWCQLLLLRQCVEALQQAARHRANRRVALLQVTSARRCQCVVLPRATGASRYGRADAPDHQAPLRQPAQRRVDRSRRDDAAASLLDMRPDGSAVGVVAKRGHRKEDQLLEFTEVAHVCMLHDRLNHYVV